MADRELEGDALRSALDRALGELGRAGLDVRLVDGPWAREPRLDRNLIEDLGRGRRLRHAGALVRGDVKTALLRLLSRLGLLLPAFRVWERWRVLGAKTVAVGPDGLPLPPPELMVRVAGTGDAAWFVESGRLSEESIRAALARAGAPIGSLEAILDFGCGCGRVLRRWHGLDARVCGSDLSGPAIEWCRTHLPFVEVSVNALEPPLTYGDASFDLVYALSVLTHLPVETQFAWRDELGRVLRPGGHLLVTLVGDAYIEKLRGEERRIYADGECIVRRAEVAGSNLCFAIHPPAFVRDRLAVGWELVEHVPCGALGNPGQDVILLRKPSS